MLEKECSEAFSWLVKVETATNGPTADQGQGSGQITDSGEKCTVKDEVELDEKELFANNQRKVRISDFDGLEKAVEDAGENIPEHLQDIATKIQEVCGKKVTDFEYHNILILLCAAIHEMEQCVGIGRLDVDRLFLWGATFKRATNLGLELQFAEKHLKEILYAHQGFVLEERARQLEAQLKLVKQFISAEKSFKEKPLSHGLFA